MTLLGSLVLLFTGCTYGLTLPSSEPEPEGPIQVGKAELRERKALLPSAVTGPEPPPPEPAFTADRCNDLSTGGRPIDDCISGTISCGETIIGHTRGGVRKFDSTFYKKKFCTPDTTDHDSGDERVYRLVMPDGDWHATITLDTPCADLDLAAILWNDDTCPTNAHIVNRCEMWPQDGTAREEVEIVSQKASQWLVVVEGKDDEEGAFGLNVQCWKGLY